MNFEYNWKNNEANFGPPTQKEVDGGTHITFDILLRKDDQYIALRRKSIPEHEAPPELEQHPDGVLFLCHNLIRYGESTEVCVRRIVKDQSGVNVLSYKVLDLRTVLIEESGGESIKQWAIIPFIIAEVDQVPAPGVYGNEVSEVVTFTQNVPSDFAWGKSELITNFLKSVTW